MKTPDQRLIIELFDVQDGKAVKITLTGEVDMLANMVYTSMLENPVFAAIVMSAAQTYESQLESSRKALLN